MRQGRNVLLLSAALLLTATGLAPGADAASTSKAGGRSDRTPSASAVEKSRNAVRQFSGYVAAIDKSSITVERRGKKPVSRVFEKHAEMTSTGEIGKDVRVTVYYRDEDGRAVAHRVVVRPATNGSRTGR